MDPRKRFIDDRFAGLCVYCGNPPETKDHVPSKVLLDEPYPKNLPVVECCAICNSAFSLDEEYVACFVECVLTGSTDPKDVKRDKIARILRDSPALAQRIRASGKKNPEGEMIWQPDIGRLNTVILKLARGHLDFELSIQRIDQPISITSLPISMMDREKITNFLSAQPTHLLPEIGSRSFLRGCDFSQPLFDEWRVVQEGRYQYLVSQASGDFVRILLSNYLACEVRWD